MDRITSMSVLYKQLYRELADKWLQLTVSNKSGINKRTLFKKGSNGKIQPKDIMVSDFASDVGYEIIIASNTEQDQKTFAQLQKYKAVKQEMPDNKALDREYKSKLV